MASAGRFPECPQGVYRTVSAQASPPQLCADRADLQQTLPRPARREPSLRAFGGRHSSGHWVEHWMLRAILSSLAGF